MNASNYNFQRRFRFPNGEPGGSGVVMSFSAIALRAFGLTLIGALLGALVALSVGDGRLGLFIGMTLGAAGTSALGWLMLVHRHYRGLSGLLAQPEVLRQPAKPHTH